MITSLSVQHVYFLNFTATSGADDEQTESIEEANKMKYPLHLAGTVLQLFQLAHLRGLGKEPGVAMARIWDGADGALFPKST